MRLPTYLPAVALFVLCTAPCSATTILVTIDTSSLAGQSGGIYFQFNPGLNAAAASAAIQNFQMTPPGALEPTSPLNFSDGGASGNLDSDSLLISNSTSLNDYGEALILGDSIDFAVVLNLPLPLSGTSGSELDVQVTGPDLITPLLSNSPTGNIVGVSYDAVGSLALTSYSPFATITLGPPTVVPEPRNWWVVALVLLLFASRLLRYTRGARAFPI